MGATFSRIKSWVNNEILTHTDLNAEFNNILTNLTPAGVDDASATESAMQGTADPYPAATASLATSLTGELERLRYLIAQITGETYWYIDPDNSLISTGTITKETFTSTVATGTAPIIVSSTTEVANLTAANATAATTATTSTQVTDGTNNIRTKIINIGDWNMDSTSTLGIAHGLTLSNIRSVSAMVRDDSDAIYTNLTPNITDANSLAGVISYIDSTYVALGRTVSGSYDTSDYDSTSYNRGWITITYVV